MEQTRRYRYFRARSMGGGVIHLFEWHDTFEQCADFCKARKEHLQTSVDFFPVAIEWMTVFDREINLDKEQELTA